MASSDDKDSLLRQGLTSLRYYHGGAQRHQAETLLMLNGVEGTYLLRPSSEAKQFVLSVRCKGSVKHFKVFVKDRHISFGNLVFDSAEELDAHLQNKALLTTDDGVPVTLLFTYARDIEECSIYATVMLHAEAPNTTAPPSIQFTAGTKSGYLEKFGSVLKRWKIRWCVLQKTELLCYKNSASEAPRERLDLLLCDGIRRDQNRDRPYSIRLVFQNRRHGDLVLAAPTQNEQNEWMSILTFKVRSIT